MRVIRAFCLFMFCIGVHAVGVAGAEPRQDVEGIAWMPPALTKVPETSNSPELAQRVVEFLPADPFDTYDPPERFPREYKPRNIPGLGRGDLGSEGTFRTKLNGGFEYGIAEDPAARSNSVSLPPADQAGVHGRMCVKSGQRVSLVHAYPAGSPVSDSDADLLRMIMWRMNTKLAYEALRSSLMGRTLSFRVECDFREDLDWSLKPTVHRVPITGPMTASSIASQVKVAMNSIPSSYWFQREWSDARKFLVFADGGDPDGAVAGVAFSGVELMSAAGQGKDTDAAEVWNTRDQVAVVYEPYWESHTSMHELFHLMGAVIYNPGPVTGTGAGHCWVGSAVMCYDDGGPRGSSFTESICPDGTPSGFTLDCGFITFFRAMHREPTGDPLADLLNGWLEANWNAAGPENRYVTANPPWDYDVPCERCEKPRGWSILEDYLDP